MLPRALLVWVALAAVAILNGMTRERLLTPRVGPYVGHVLSTVSLCALILLVAWLTLDWLAPRGRTQAWTIGATWLSLTLAFEFLAGHYAFGHPWSRLLADYNILRGRLWVLVLLTTLFAPMWIHSVS